MNRARVVLFSALASARVRGLQRAQRKVAVRGAPAVNIFVADRGIEWILTFACPVRCRASDGRTCPACPRDRAS